MRKFQSCNFSSVGCSAPGPCSLEKAESIYSKLREMCYHSMFIYLFPFRLEKLFDQGEYSFAMFYVYIIRNLRCKTSHRRWIKMGAIINENTCWYIIYICSMYIIHCTCMFTAERKLEQWRHSFGKVGAVHSPSARSAIIDIFITIIIIIINIIFLFFYF